MAKIKFKDAMLWTFMIGAIISTILTFGTIILLPYIPLALQATTTSAIVVWAIAAIVSIIGAIATKFVV